MPVIEYIDSINKTGSVKTIERSRLLDILFSKRDKNVLLIQSPAGYGKTALIQDFLQKYKLKSTWINVTNEMNYFYSFIYNLVLAIKLVDPAFGNNTLQLLESRREKLQLSKNKRGLAIELSQTFINDFNKQFEQDVYVVIDDFHNIEESSWLKTFFEKLFNNIPKKIHLTIISRSVPDISFINLVVENKFLRLGTEDLVFRHDEISKLLTEIYCIDSISVDTEILEKNIGGWITGIHMLLQTYGKDFDKLEIHSQKIPENIYDYLADEIFRSLNTESRKFLLSTTVMENFSEDICSYLKEIYNANSVFKDLIDKNLILKSKPVSLNGSNSNCIYNYNKLFRKYLSSKINETCSKEKIKELNSFALKYYKSRNDTTSLLNHLFSIRDFETGIPLMINNFEKLFNEGKLVNLWNWLTVIDHNITESNPYLVFYKAMLYKFFIGDLNLSLEYLKKAISMFKKENDTDFLIKCYINKASLLLNLGMADEVIDELTGLLHEETTPEYLAKLKYYLGLAYYQYSRYDISVNFLNKALEICITNKLYDFERHVYILLGHIYLIKGEYRRSISYYESITDGNPNILDKFETLCNLTLLNSQSANFSKSRKYIEQLDDIISNFPSAIFRIPYLLAKQAYYFESGKYQENVKVLTEIAKLASSMNHKNYLYLCYRLLSDTHFYTGNLECAQIYYEYAFSCLSNMNENEMEKIELAVVKSLIRKEIEPADEVTESILLLAYDYYEKHGLHYSKVQTSFHLADYYFNQRNIQEAMHYFRECLVESKEREYNSHLLRALSRSEKLFQYALSNKIEEEFINKLVILKSEVFS